MVTGIEPVTTGCRVCGHPGGARLLILSVRGPDKSTHAPAVSPVLRFATPVRSNHFHTRTRCARVKVASGRRCSSGLTAHPGLSDCEADSVAHNEENPS